MREPKVRTGKRTMAYMAISLAILAAVFFSVTFYGIFTLFRDRP